MKWAPKDSPEAFTRVGLSLVDSHFDQEAVKLNGPGEWYSKYSTSNSIDGRKSVLGLHFQEEMKCEHSQQ